MNETEKNEPNWSVDSVERTASALLSTSRDPVLLIDPTGLVHAANQKAFRFFDLTEPLSGSMRLGGLTPASLAQELGKALEEVVTSADALRMETSYRKGEKTRWVEINLLPLGCEPMKVQLVAVLLNEITEKKEIEHRFVRDALRYQGLEDSLDSVTVTDLEGNIVSVNERALRQHGLTRQQQDRLLGINAFSLIDPEFRKLAQQNLEKTLTTGQTRNAQYRFIRSDGSVYWGELCAALVQDMEGRPSEFIGVIRDITDQKMAEMELQRRNMELARANSKLEKLDKAKDEFIATISHELRTPLVTGMGYVDLLLHGGLGPISTRISNRMKVALKNLKRLSRLIDEILEYHRLSDTTKTGKLSRTAFDIEEICYECVSELLMRSDRAPDSLKVIATEKMPAVWADENRIRQVIANLLDNADRHAGSQARVWIKCWLSEDGCVGIAVSDNGRGMPDDIRPRAFEPFVKSEDSEDGTGLGLAIVHQILTAHGCQVLLESRPDAGTTVSFFLPAVKGPVRRRRITPEFRPPVDLHSARILVVEDDVETLDFLELALSSSGYRVEMAPTAERALSAMRADPPDMAIVDITLPGIDGLELCRQLKSDPITASIPICILTARTEEEMQLRATSMGCESYLLKPVSITELVSSVTKILEYPLSFRPLR